MTIQIVNGFIIGVIIVSIIFMYIYRNLKEEINYLNNRNLCKPYYYQYFYFISCDLTVRVRRWEDEANDFDMLYIGNCFKTKEEAEDALKIVKNIIKKEFRGYHEHIKSTELNQQKEK